MIRYEIQQVCKNKVIHSDFIRADRMIVLNGCYQFQNNDNTNTVEKLEKEFKNPVAVDDMMQPIYVTRKYYPINKFIIKVDV